MEILTGQVSPPWIATPGNLNLYLDQLSWNLQNKAHLSRQWNCGSFRCSWSIACRRCFNYIFMLHPTPGFNRLHKDNCETRRETFKFWNLVPYVDTSHSQDPRMFRTPLTILLPPGWDCVTVYIYAEIGHSTHEKTSVKGSCLQYKCKLLSLP